MHWFPFAHNLQQSYQTPFECPHYVLERYHQLANFSKQDQYHLFDFLDPHQNSCERLSSDCRNLSSLVIDLPSIHVAGNKHRLLMFTCIVYFNHIYHPFLDIAATDVQNNVKGGTLTNLQLWNSVILPPFCLSFERWRPCSVSHRENLRTRTRISVPLRELFVARLVTVADFTVSDSLLSPGRTHSIWGVTILWFVFFQLFNK